MIGKLRHRIILQKQVVIKDSIGQETEKWKDVETVWARVEPLSGKEYFNAKQTNSEVSSKITIRYLVDITSQMRVIFQEHTYNILSVINFEERNKYLQLLCTEKLGEEDD